MCLFRLQNRPNEYARRPPAPPPLLPASIETLSLFPLRDISQRDLDNLTASCLLLGPAHAGHSAGHAGAEKEKADADDGEEEEGERKVVH
eukprot:3706333-Rhodomonas_salina.1